MSTDNGIPRRRREPGERNRNIYRRYDGRFEVGYRDSTSRQRWTRPFDTITAARAARDDLLGRKARGDQVRPNPRLRFGEAADRWLAEQVTELRPATQDIYRNAVDNHLRPRWERRRLDTIDVNDVATVVRELRAAGLSERTIGGIVQVAGRVFKFAARRMDWRGTNPLPLLETSERPRTTTRKRRIYKGAELAQTLAASHVPWRTLFALACITGARKSELLGLQWQSLDLADPEAASIQIRHQLDRRGRRQPLKTTASARSVDLPRSLAVMLLKYKVKAVHSGDDDLVFATRTGRPLSQRNVLRALRAAQKRARTPDGKPTFPVLHEDRPVPPGAVPTFHGFRHTAASHAIAAGDSAEEISWMLGHKDSTVTRQVYIQEVNSAERKARIRAKLETRYGT
ncbi:MAG: tyrosine-type recombinase/integrase, partial [Gammaproteobacteria bacterium]